MKLFEHERLVLARLVEAGVDSPGLCARLLTAHAAGLTKNDYILHDDLELAKDKEELLRALTERRASGEPMAYLLGYREFYEHEFYTEAGVLVPRPETELLVEQALDRLPHEDVVLADVCCGSGCIGLSLLAQRPAWRGILLDNSWQALALAARNAAKIAPQARIVAGDIFQLPLRYIDLLIANPPYIAREETALVMPEVLAFEPHEALFSDNRGLAHIIALAGQAGNVLRSGGWLMLEHGAGQREAVMQILLDNGFACCEDFSDLAGHPRCAVARKL